MKKKVIDLEIIEDLEESGVEKISLVDRPAIDVQWFAFQEEDFIEPNPCWEGYEAYGTKMLNGREVPNCIKIQNKEEKFVEPKSGETQSDYMSRCVPYMIDEGKDQDQAVAICISTYERMSYDTSNLPPYVEQVPKKKKKMEFEPVEIDIFGFKPKHFDMCPGAVATFTHIMEMVVPKETEGMIRSAALIADRIFEIEKMVMENDIATEEEMKEAILLLDDFKDVMNEVDEDLGMVHDIDYMDGHILTISKYLPEQFQKKLNMQKQFFMNEDEQILVGPVMIPNIEIARKDPKTKELYYVKFSEQVIRKTAEKFMRELRNRETNIQHEENEAGSYVFESWIIDNLEDKANTHYQFNLPVGTWMVSMRVEDDTTWKKVKEGKLTGYSLEGNFLEKDEYERFKRDRETYEKIMKILGGI